MIMFPKPKLAQKHSIVYNSEVQPSVLQTTKDNYTVAQIVPFDSTHTYTEQQDKLNYLIVLLYFKYGDKMKESREFKSVQSVVCNYNKTDGIKIDYLMSPAIDYHEVIDMMNKDLLLNFIFSNQIGICIKNLQIN